MPQTKINYRVIILPILLIIGIAALPLVFWPWGLIKYEIPRVWFIQRWIETMCIMGLIFSPVLFRSRRIDKSVLYYTVGFMIVAFMSSILGVDPIKSIWGNYYRADGLITFVHLLGFTLFLFLFWQDNWSILLTKGIVFGSLLTNILTLISAFQLFILRDGRVMHWENGALGATFGNPNFLAGYLVVTLPFLMYLLDKFKKKRNRMIMVGAIIIQTTTIGFTQSWGGITGVVIFWYGWLMFSKNKYKFLYTGIFLGIIIIFLGLYGSNYQKVGFVAQSRERIFRRILLGVIKRPLLGFGWANIDYAFEKVDWPIKFEHDVYVDKAHSMILEVLATTGVVGLIAYILLIGRVAYILIKRLIKYDDLWIKTLLLSFLLYLFHSQTNVISVGEELIFWLIVGIVGSRLFVTGFEVEGDRVDAVSFTRGFGPVFE